MKIISLIGYSGSGKTHFIVNATRRLKNQLNYNIAVIKNVHKHQIDEKGKDSHKFSEAGASYSVIKNIYNEIGIFFKREFDIQELINWLLKGPIKIDLLFIEGFRNLTYPTILCVKELTDIKSQLTKEVKLISGKVNSKNVNNFSEIDIPIINLEKEFHTFLNVFHIS